MFSSDLSDDQLRMKLGQMSNIPCQVGICLVFPIRGRKCLQAPLGTSFKMFMALI